jgi:hypothetical protein
MQVNPSKDQLVKSQERRIRSLMVRTLEKFESAYPGVQHTKDAKVFKGDLRTIFNDVIRAQRDELTDYEVDFRPLRVTDDNTISITRTFMQTVQKIEFGYTSATSRPFIKIYADQDHKNSLEAIHREFGGGVIYSDKSGLTLEIVGAEDCIKCVLPIMDRYRLHDSVRVGYREWRKNVVDEYRR